MIYSEGDTVPPWLEEDSHLNFCSLSDNNATCSPCVSAQWQGVVALILASKPGLTAVLHRAVQAHCPSPTAATLNAQLLALKSLVLRVTHGRRLFAGTYIPCIGLSADILEAWDHDVGMTLPAAVALLAIRWTLSSIGVVRHGMSPVFFVGSSPLLFDVLVLLAQAFAFSHCLIGPC